MRLPIFFFLLALCPIVSGQINTTRLDSIVQSHIEDHSFEGRVLIASAGRAIYEKSAGYRDPSQISPVTGETPFPIASITKMITAIQVLQLKEEGKLTLDDRLEKLLPDLNIPNASEISVHHLLLHISGLPNEDDAIYEAACSPEDFIRLTVDRKNMIQDPGVFNYANIDYILLGLIIERLDERSWEESTHVRILTRAGMHHTGFLSKDNKPSGLTATFSLQGEKRVKDASFHIENYYAAGCMYSTAEDLLKLDQALYTGTLLGEQSKLDMYTSYPEYNYTGYSVWTYNYPFLDAMPLVMERRGGIRGANCVLIRFLELNRSIVILSNNNAFNPDSFGDLQGMKEALMMELGADSDED